MASDNRNACWFSFLVDHYKQFYVPLDSDVVPLQEHWSPCDYSARHLFRSKVYRFLVAALCESCEWQDHCEHSKNA